MNQNLKDHALSAVVTPASAAKPRSSPEEGFDVRSNESIPEGQSATRDFEKALKRSPEEPKNLINALEKGLNPGPFVDIFGKTRNSLMLKQVFQGIVFRMNREKLTEELLTAGDGGDLDKIKSLLAQGVPVNAQNKDGKTVLMCASINGHTDCVAFLLAGAGLPKNIPADPNIKTNIGETALLVGSAHGTAEIVESLIAAKADVNAKAYIGRETPLMMAAREGRWDNALLLLRAGADIYASTAAWGRQAWDFARGSNHPEVEQQLKDWAAGKRDFDALSSKAPGAGNAAPEIEQVAAPQSPTQPRGRSSYRIRRRRSSHMSD